MLQSLIKIVLTSVLVVAISGGSQKKHARRRHSGVAADYVAPRHGHGSIMTRATPRRSPPLPQAFFWLILPSLTLLLAFPFLLRKGICRLPRASSSPSR